MNCFQLIKTVLDEAYVAIPGDDAAKDAAICKAATDLSSEYKGLLQSGCLDYADSARRFAYIYKYTTSHANIVYKAIAQSGDLGQVFDQDKLSVACVGGGPGSDFLGILKYCLRHEKSPELRCQILDRDATWGESWSDVDDKLGPTFRISTLFHPLDVTDPASWGRFKKHFGADLITMIYFMSEVYAVRDQANQYFEALFAGAARGSRILFVDNNSAQFYQWFDGLAKKHGFTTLASSEGTAQLPFDEEKTDLEPYYSKFNGKGHCPKIRADIAIRVVQKA